MRYVALLRGINVGGHKKISMAHLRELVNYLGHGDVSTYIQSGNVIFSSSGEDSAMMAQEIEERIASDLGLEVAVLVRSRDELAVVVAGNPFLLGETGPAGLHVSFLAEPADERLSELDARRFEPDEFQIGDRVLYLHTPNGMGKTAFTPDFWKRLGPKATTRNWNTVTRLLALANG